LKTNHAFIFQPGRWIGTGKITLSFSPEVLRFRTAWDLQQNSAGEILAKQLVEIEQNDSTINHFSIYAIDKGTFKISLESELIGAFGGVGIYDAKTIAWEFTAPGSIEGYEVFELQDNGEYIFHSEYASQDLFRTVIDGRIWKKC